MKVLHVINSLYSGGAEKLVLELVTSEDNPASIEYGVCPLVLHSDSREDDICKRLVESGVVVHKIRRKPSDNRLYTLWMLTKIIRHSGYDVVHTHCFSPDIYGRIGAFLSFRRVRIVNTLHTMQHRTTRIRKFAEKMLSHITDVHIACSSAVKQWAIRDGALKEHKIQVVHNGVSLKRNSSGTDWYQILRAELDVNSDNPLLGWVGRISKEKNTREIVYILSELKKLGVEGHAILVGTGEERHVVEQAAEELDLTNNVHFLGYREDALDLMSAFDVFVLPSIREGMPLVVLEALAAGIPVVANDLQGLYDVIVNGETGVLIEDNSPTMFSVKIKELLDDENYRMRLVQNGKEKAHEFSIERTVREYVSIYEGFYKGVDLKRVSSTF